MYIYRDLVYLVHVLLYPVQVLLHPGHYLYPSRVVAAKDL